MRTSFENLAAVVGPLHWSLKYVLAGKKRTKQGANTGRVVEPRSVPLLQKNALQSTTTLAYPKEGWKKLMFPDANNLYW